MEHQDSGLYGSIRRIKIGGKGKRDSSAPGGSKKLGKWKIWTAIGVLLFAAYATYIIGAIISPHYASTENSTALFGKAGNNTGAQGIMPVQQFSANVQGMPGSVTNARDSVAGSGAAVEAPQTDQAQVAQPPTTGGQTSQTAPWDDLKIIRTATMQVSVKDVNAGVSAVMSLVSQHGGRVLQMDTHQESDYTVSSITMQVPSEEFDKIMPDLRKLGGQVKKVVQENVSSSDVTEEYTDLQSQLRNLQATEARMLALQQKATALEDILSLDRELRQLQGDIERIQGRINFLSKRSEMSSITISLAPEAAFVPMAATPEPTNVWDPGEIALRAWNASLDLLSKAATVAIVIVVFFWWAIPVGLLVAWLVRRSRRQAAISPAPQGEPSAS